MAYNAEETLNEESYQEPDDEDDQEGGEEEQEEELLRQAQQTHLNQTHAPQPGLNNLYIRLCTAMESTLRRMQFAEGFPDRRVGRMSNVMRAGLLPVFWEVHKDWYYWKSD